MIDCIWMDVFSMDRIEDFIAPKRAGVYVLWTMDRIGIQFLDVGSGQDVRERVADHREQMGAGVNVRWTWLPDESEEVRLGIEAYLADRFNLRGEAGRRYPDVPMIRVTHPFQRRL